MKEFLLNLLSSTIETVGESKLISLLQELHDKNVDTYTEAVKGSYSLFKLLTPLAAKTATGIDDAVIAAVKEALETSASNNGITL